jgi:hypothetical protein
MSIVTNDNTTKINELPESIFTPKVVGTILVAFLAGGLSVSLFAYFNRMLVLKMIFPSSKTVERVSPENIPTCISSDIKGSSDKDFIVYSLKYDEMMKPRLQTLLTKLSNENYKSLVNSALVHLEKETELMKNLYKIETKKNYVSANEKASLLGALPFPDDILSQNGFTEEERISLLRGIFESMGRDYYSVVASVTKNTTLKENAMNFLTFKADFVKKMATK